MKKLVSLYLFVLLAGAKGVAQEKNRGIAVIETRDIKSDSINLSPNKDFEKRIKLKPIEDSQCEVEIRFYEREELSNTRNLIVLELKNKTWRGMEYSESNYPKVKIGKFALKASNEFTEVVQKLYQNNLTRLPSQDDLKPKMKKYGAVDPKRGRAEQVIFVNDGESYTIEFMIGGKFRIYNFNNPEIYSEFYNDVQELKDYVFIKNTFKSEFKRK